MAFESVPFASIAKLKQGKYLAPEKMSDLPTTDKHVPVIGGNGVLGYTDRSSYSIGVPLITCRGSRCGLLQWADAPVWVSNNAIGCDTGSLDGNLVLRYVISATSFVDVITGSAQPQITVGHLAAKRLNMPPSSIWSDLVGTLSPLDDRIELLSKTNATLESIALALFKSWFVDFDPVRAKAEGREPEGIDAATASLFPSEFEDSEIGPIPKGWRVDDMGRVASCVGGATPSTKDSRFWVDGIHHWATPKDLSGLQAPILTNTERLITDEGASRISSGVLPPGTLLISSRAPIGYLAVSGIPTAINQGFIAIPAGGRLPPSYLLFWASSNMELIKQKANGSTFMEISKSAFRSIKVCVPSPAVVDAFSATAEALLMRIELNERHKASLGQVRDSLLPRLISGKLRLVEVEAAAADVS